jgi:hypothetical protein
MVIDPAGGTTGSDAQGNYRSQRSAAAAEKGGAAGIAAQHCRHHPTNGWPLTAKSFQTNQR